MPELPEVEIVRQSLSKNIKGKKINQVLVRNRNLRFKLKHSFENKLKNKFILDIKRFSKYLIIEFENRSFCIIHLGMSGTIHIIKDKKKSSITNTSFYHSPMLPEKHNHVEFFFSNFKLIYNDPRRFGFFIFVDNKINLEKRFQKFGPEPFDKKFNLKHLTDSLNGKKKISRVFY